MRRVLFALLLLVVTPALAADWGQYANARFGYAVAVPPGFVGQGESDNSDGQVFRSPTATLTVWGGNILSGDFESEFRARQQSAADGGWGITYQVSTPSNGSYSGKRGGRIMYTRLIALCGGSQFAAFELDYSRADLSKFDPVVTRLVQSFRGGKGATC